MTHQTQTQTPSNSNAAYTAVVETLRQQFGCAAVSPGAALRALPGPVAQDPASAARQRRHRGTYPFPIRVIGQTSAVLISDIAAVMLGLSLDDKPEPEQPAAAKRPGRPRKSVQAGGAK